MGRTGRDAVFAFLPEIRDKYNIDFVIANGENSSGGLGMNRKAYDELRRAGVDYFTMGNHTFSKREIIALMNEGENIVRPANMPTGTPGCGMATVTAPCGAKIAVINLIGRVYLDEKNTSPFDAAAELAKEAHKKTPIVIIDFHAEATSEKEALGYYMDGNATAVLGTHTHIQTADERILENGCAYITDVGRTGARDSVLGLDTNAAIARFTYAANEKKPPFKVARGKYMLCGVVLTIDPQSGRSEGIERICLSEK